MNLGLPSKAYILENWLYLRDMTLSREIYFDLPFMDYLQLLADGNATISNRHNCSHIITVVS
jgi:hypothetical protein